LLSLYKLWFFFHTNKKVIAAAGAASVTVSEGTHKKPQSKSPFSISLHITHKHNTTLSLYSKQNLDEDDDNNKNNNTNMFAEENGLKGDPRLQAISQAIRVVPHFPKHGLSFSLFDFSNYFILFEASLLRSLLFFLFLFYYWKSFSCFVAAVSTFTQQICGRSFSFVYF